MKTVRNFEIRKKRLRQDTRTGKGWSSPSQINSSDLITMFRIPQLTAALLFFCVPVLVNANPISVNYIPLLEKSSESCLISVASDIATVSCEVDYRITQKSLKTRVEEIYIPFYWPDAHATDSKAIEKTVAARLECNDQIYKPVETGIYPSLASDQVEGAKKAYSKFLITLTNDIQFRIVASYNQPLINKTVYYLPYFEGEKSPSDTKKFAVSFFPTSGNSLELLTNHPNRSDVRKTRILINPAHLELIAVRQETSSTNTIPEMRNRK
jgi:hypothetical protein